MGKEIKEISCNAKNCIYNENGCHCTANHVDVGTSSASTSSETYCSTFKTSDCKDCKI